MNERIDFLTSTQKLAFYNLKTIFKEAKVPFPKEAIIRFVEREVTGNKVLVERVKFLRSSPRFVYKERGIEIAIEVLEFAHYTRISVNFSRYEY